MGKIDDVLDELYTCGYDDKRRYDNGRDEHKTFEIPKAKQSLYKVIEDIVNACETFPMAHIGAISIENYQDENYCIKKQELLDKLKKEVIGSEDRT